MTEFCSITDTPGVAEQAIGHALIQPENAPWWTDRASTHIQATLHDVLAFGP